MLYLFIDTKQVKLLYLKKSLLGQYEASLFSKEYQSDFIQSGKIVNTDFVASAIKEALQSIFPDKAKDTQVLLILPQESYEFLRMELPNDVAPSAVESFIKDKAGSELSLNFDEYSYDYTVVESNNEKHIQFFALKQEVAEKYDDALELIDLNLRVILPEAICYYKLFEKTLRKDKKENIFYVSYEKQNLKGLLYDSFGLQSKDKWVASVPEQSIVETALAEKTADWEKKGKKLNRVILGGLQSEKVRQDTFTKSIGVWTNPLKRIFPEFYQEYLKLFVSSSNTPFSVLAYEACVGAFIVSDQNKDLSLLNHAPRGGGRKIALPLKSIFGKEALLFLISFVASFVLFVFLSRMNIQSTLTRFTQKPTATSTPVPPTSTPIPTPSLKRAEVKIKVLNGSGTRGKAGEVKDLLKEKGYQEILTDNADDFDYTQSELQVKKTKLEVGAMLKSDLKENVSSFKESDLAEKEAADVVIIIGSDFK